jgi:hypothetical protein
MVHGVGLHDHLSALLRAYQSLRANVTSFEAPLLFEDLIPGWKLADFDESASPPFLKLEARVETKPGEVGTIYLYEVNYSAFAGVVRRNHAIDMTRLFVGFDLAICSARQHLARAKTATSVLGGDSQQLARCLQRFSGILTAATVPILGLPSILLRNYTRTFVATFTRFFEDIATFALDKNGEQLISAHLDRVVDNIKLRSSDGDRFVVAAHSLGSVVVHNFVVRHWQAQPRTVPDLVVTFGSPIGLLAWTWLFLDFPEMRFNPKDPIGSHYFCWSPVNSQPGGREPLSWINVVNCLDPIATAFPTSATDMSAAVADISSALKGGAVATRFFGRTRISQIGASHSEYVNDRDGFLQILLRGAGFKSGNPEDVAGIRTPEENWNATHTVLEGVQPLLLVSAALLAAGYFVAIARAFDEWRTLYLLPLFLLPRLTIGVLTFFQRLLLGAPTKRIAKERIGTLDWFGASFPHRLRNLVAGLVGLGKDVDPLARSPGAFTRLLIVALSFVPSLAAIAAPPVLAWRLSGRSPHLDFGIATTVTIVLLGSFFYVVACAGHELIATWRQVLWTLAQPSPAAASSLPHAAPPTPPSP